MLTQAVDWARSQGGSSQEQLHHATDRLATLAGREILGLIPGVVSTEVDARLSFDTQATIARARRMIDLYQDLGVDTGRVLIKIASTWEGIRAAEQLEKAGIRCNLTLLFSFHQAVACAQAGAHLVSPFVGRILDWHLKASGKCTFAPDEDPGVLSVQRIYNYFKAFGYDTVVMGASFRNTGEIEQLAGCDRLTISPDLLQALSEDFGPLQRRLSADIARTEEPRWNLARSLTSAGISTRTRWQPKSWPRASAVLPPIRRRWSSRCQTWRVPPDQPGNLPCSERIHDFLQQTFAAGRRPARATPPDTAQRLALAGTALMIQLARVDRNEDRVELQRIAALAVRVHGLSEAESRELIELAQASADDATSLYEFTAFINDALDQDDKQSLLVDMWDVALADQKIDKHEEHLIRRVADLLHLNHREYIEARLSAEARQTSSH